jgi:hypothetical protein
MAKDASGHGTRPLRTSGRWNSPQPRRRQPCAARPARPDPDGEQIGTATADGADDTRRCHTAIVDRQARPIIRIRKMGGRGQRTARQRGPETIPCGPGGRAFWTRWTGSHARRRIEAKMPAQVLSNLRHSPARSQGLWGADRRERPRPENCRNPDPHRPHEPLHSPRNRRDHSRGLKPTGKGATMPQARVAQQCRILS